MDFVLAFSTAYFNNSKNTVTFANRKYSEIINLSTSERQFNRHDFVWICTYCHCTPVPPLTPHAPCTHLVVATRVASHFDALLVE